MNGRTFSLKPFPAAGPPPRLKIEGNISRSAEKIAIHCAFLGPMSEVAIPAPAPMPARRDALWEETCFEFFVTAKGFDQYWEFNLSPAGHWNVYHFESYRKGMREEMAFRELPFSVERQPQALRFSLEFNPDGIIPAADQALKVAVSAVIKLADGGMTYWALIHPGPQPDFHHKGSFILEL